MRRRTFLKHAAVGAAGTGLLGACARSDDAAAGAAEAGGGGGGPAVSWRLASSFPRGLDILYGSAEVLAQRVAALTGGRFRIRVHPAGEVVPGLQVMDAVQQGTVQAGHTASYYYIGKSPALAFDTGVPFGFMARQHHAWLYHGGGLDLIRQIFADFGIMTFPCGNTGVQMGGWFRRPVGSVSDLRGLRMRIPGLGGEVMSRLGVTVQVLAGGDIYPALERGAIDATEWVGPHDDEKLGFYRIAPHYYYPGWWEPGVTLSLHVNRRAWDALPEVYKEILESATREVNQDMLARYDAANPEALVRLVKQHGVQLRPYSDEILEAAYRESQGLLADLAAKDATFRRVYEHWQAFRARSLPYFAGPELRYMAFAFPKLGSLAASTAARTG
ncbi:MAG: TRAP transporter substrate-binding protein [Gemmatimonadetes bacterium]|nr:TRAP transporter substrate-binding protein [Gemmatimonadota bacterium]